MSTQASLEAYDRIIGSIKSKRRQAFEEIARCDGKDATYGRTINEICERLGWRYSTTSARVSELAARGVICPSGKMAGGQTIWIRTPADEIDKWREAARLKKRGVEAKVFCFEGLGGPAAFGPDQTMRITVEMKRSEWMALKNTRIARFA